MSKLKLTYIAIPPQIRQAELIKKDDILKSICVEDEGCFYQDEESGEPDQDCEYGKLTERGYTGLVLGGLGAKDWGHLNQICQLIYRIAAITCIAAPKCRKLTTIAHSCKFIMFADIAKNTVGEVYKDTSNTGYIPRKVGGFGGKAGAISRQLENPKGGFGKGYPTSFRKRL